MVALKDIIQELELRIADPEMNGRMPLKPEMMRHWAEALGKVQAERIVSRTVLNAAADAFTQYEEHHLRKAMPDRPPGPLPPSERLEAYDKAVRNKVLAARCRSAAL